MDGICLNALSVLPSFSSFLDLFIHTSNFLRQNRATLKQLVPDQLLFQIPKVLLNVPLGCAGLNRKNQAASSDVHVSLTQMVATTSSISSKPSVTQAPPNCVFPAPSRVPAYCLSM